MIQLLFGSKEFKKVFEQMSSVRLFIRKRFLFVLTQSHHKLQKVAQKKRKEKKRKEKKRIVQLFFASHAITQWQLWLITVTVN